AVIVGVLQLLPRVNRLADADRLVRVGARLADLLPHVLDGGEVELRGELAVATGPFVERTDAVPHPLAGDEDRRLDPPCEDRMLEGRAVMILHEVLDEPDL